MTARRYRLYGLGVNAIGTGGGFSLAAYATEKAAEIAVDKWFKEVPDKHGLWTIKLIAPCGRVRLWQRDKGEIK